MKNKVKGAFSLVFLVGDGMHAFSGKRGDVIRSFFIMFGLLPFVLWTNILYPPHGMETGYSVSSIMTTAAVQFFLSLFLSLGVLLVTGMVFGRLHTLGLFLEASNWTALASFILCVPFITLAVTGWLPRDEMDRIFVIITIYFYVVTGCIVNRTFQLNWQLAAAIACFLMLADLRAWEWTMQLRHIPDLAG
jgi:hypothetical protein